MRLNEAIEMYLSYVKRQHSPGTHRFESEHLNTFMKWCEARGLETIEDISRYDVIDDFIFNMKKTCANITINKRIGILKRMFRHLEIDFKYLQSIEKLKERVVTYDMVDIDDLKRIRYYIKNQPNEVGNSLLYKCMIYLLSDTGCRLNELLNIELKNVNFKENEILLTTTKTKEDRVVYFGQECAKHLKDMSKVEHNHKYLLHNKIANRQTNVYDVEYLMKKLKRKLSIKKLHAHMFRHSFITLFLEQGADIKSAQEIAGHKNLETTQRYIHKNTKHIKKQYEDMFKID